MLAWFTRFIAGLLVATLCGLIIVVIFDSTLLNAKYLETQAEKVRVYDRVAAALPAQLTKDSQGDKAAAQAALSQVITPALVKTKLETTLAEVQGYYKGTGPAPTLDLSDVVAQAKAAGLDIPAGSGLDKPIVLTDPKLKAQGFIQQFETSKLITFVLVLVLFAFLLFLSWERHRYLVLPDIAIACGAILGLLAAAFSFAPGLVDHYAHLDFASNAYLSIGHDLVTHISHDQGVTFGIVAAALFFGGLILRIILGRMTKVKKIVSPSTAG